MRKTNFLLIFAILVFSLFAVQTQATTTDFALSGDARDIGVEVGDTWSYDINEDINIENPSYEQSVFVEPWETSFGPIVVMVDINYTTYWEVELTPEVVYATLDFQLGDLSSTTADAVEVRYVYAQIYNRTYLGGEYVADIHFAALYYAEDNPSGTILDSYDSFSLTFDYLSWWFYWLEVYEWDAYIELTVGLKAYNAVDTYYGGWYSAPFDEERPSIDIYPNGWHSRSGHRDYTLTSIEGELYTASEYTYMETSAGIVANDYESTKVCNISRWIVGSIFAGRASFDGETIVDLHGLSVPVQYCIFELGSAQYYTSYSSKCGVMVEHVATHERGGWSLTLSSASFEYASTEADLSMTISQLSYDVESGSSFDVNAVIVNDGELSAAFTLEVIGVGFSGSASWVIDGLTQKVVALSVVSESGLDAGVYNVDIRFKCDGETIEQKTITVDLTHPTTTDNGTTDGEATDGDDQPISPVIIGTVIGVFGIIIIAIVMGQRKRKT